MRARSWVVVAVVVLTLVPASDGAKGNGPSPRPSISDDGRHVSFESQASNLDAADTDAVSDVFVRDLVSGTTSS